MVTSIEANSLAARIIEANEGHSIQWLSGYSGIPYSTLKRNLERTPENFTAGQLASIAKALDVPVASFFGEAA